MSHGTVIRRLAEGLAHVRSNWRSILRDGLLITVASMLQAVVFDVFLASSNTAPGGIAGITIILSRFIDWPKGMMMLVLSLPMLWLGFRFLGRAQFVIYTFYATVVYTSCVDLLVHWLPAGGITHDPLLNALYGGVLGGIGSGLVLRGRGNFADTGIISRIIQLKTGMPLTQLYMMIDGCIIAILGAVFGWEKALYSLIMLFAWGLATDYTLEGPSVIRTVFIVTDSPREVADVLLTQLGVGVTAWTGEGMFTATTRTVLFCTVIRPDVAALQGLVAATDPHAFVVIGQGHQASGGVVRPR